MDESAKVRIPLSPMENLAVGAAGGALETSLQMPLITYKICAQEGRAFPTTIPAWYRGVAVQAGTLAPITALQFMVNGMLQNMVKRGEQRDLTDAEVVGAAAGAGAISALVYGPVDLVTIQQQKLHLNPIGTIRHVLGEYGVAHGLFRGFAACAVREAVYTAGYLGLAPVATARLTQNVEFLQDKPLMASITGACLAGGVSAILTHPVDTAKTKIQADLAGTSYPSARAAIKSIWNEKGVHCFFKGALPRTTRICGAFFICMTLRDVATDYKTKWADKSTSTTALAPAKAAA